MYQISPTLLLDIAVCHTTCTTGVSVYTASGLQVYSSDHQPKTTVYTGLEVKIMFCISLQLNIKINMTLCILTAWYIALYYD